ncbi:hypothetical protein EVG20_g246 [Dentipellis fragilis]|uniref:DUF7719 domain-containing protein n=1 Tax=Dentipellis fragilis TaxID=205917 RepID=A0A4Y9ZEZ4_9AGAM|nr:hypothetical protein EVG20_g246 [Dentipellis fragilis]
MAKGHKTAKKPTIPLNPPIDIPEEEQWRIIRESGILKQAATQPAAKEGSEDDDEYPLAEEIFVATTLFIPLAFFLLLMHILIHFQYGQEPNWGNIVGRMSSGAPILAVFTFYTNRHKGSRRAQFLLWLLALAAGIRLIHLVNYGNWLTNIQQCPAIATVWVLTIIQLELGPAVTSLIGVGLWVWWSGMQILFK